jgi:hypothetical protein
MINNKIMSKQENKILSIPELENMIDDECLIVRINQSMKIIKNLEKPKMNEAIKFRTEGI